MPRVSRKRARRAAAMLALRERLKLRKKDESCEVEEQPNPVQSFSPPKTRSSAKRFSLSPRSSSTSNAVPLTSQTSTSSISVRDVSSISSHNVSSPSRPKRNSSRTYSKRKISYSSLVELPEKTVDEAVSECGDSNQSFSEDDLPTSPIHPAEEYDKDKDLLTLIEKMKVKKNLNFKEIHKCLEELPSINVDTSCEMEDEASTSTFSAMETQDIDVDDPFPSTSKGKGESIRQTRSYFDFFVPENFSNAEDLGAICSSYEEAMDTLINYNPDVPLESEEEELEPSVGPTRFEIDNVFDRKFEFDFHSRMSGNQPCNTTAEASVIQIKKLSELTRKAKHLCPHCESRNLVYNLKKTHFNFFCPTLELKCKSSYCKKTLGRVPVHETINFPLGQRKTDVMGFRMAIGALDAGVGYRALRILNSSQNLPTISESVFQRHTVEALKLIEKSVENMKDQAAQIVTKYYQNLGYELKDDMMNVPVCFNDTWLTRGYSSLIALGFVVEVETGIILDFEVLSQYCSYCAQHVKKEKDMTPQEILQWKEKHKKDCQINYSIEKSSTSMEGEIAEILFKRSVKRNLRYTKLISDDDSSTYGRLLKLNPYGKKYPTKKENCLDHISKKIYRRINKLKISHHLEEKFAQNTATVFANFYRIFVKKFDGNHFAIKRNILASVFHHAATDEYPLHQLCPREKDSWCKYQRDISNRIVIKNDWHKDKNNRKCSLEIEAASAVLGVMLSMTTDEVLSVVAPKAQTIIESLHSKVWDQVETSNFGGLRKVRYAASRVSLIHNCGPKFGSIIRCLGIELGDHFEDGE